MRAVHRLGMAVLAMLHASRAFAITLPPGFEVAVVASGLDSPTAAEFAPDGRLFILEKPGRVRVWKPGAGLLPAPVLVVPTCTASEMGLLGLTFAPDFAESGGLILYHTQPPGGDPQNCGTPAGRTNRVVRVTVAGDTVDPASLVVLFDGIRTDNGNHDGGALAIGPDGFLYVGTGDSGIGDHGAPGDATNPYARDPTSPNGKILRLTLDGHGAPGNPFAGRGGASDAVFARGLRNPWRFTFQPSTGLLWVGDVGQGTWEEVDVVRAGDDLGWPRCEGPDPVPPCPGDTVPPVHWYAHRGQGASITGGVFYDGTQFAPAFRGNYFFGDFVFDIIWRAVPRAGNDGFEASPAVFARDAAAPVHFTLGPDGALYYVAISAGEVRRITQGAPRTPPDPCTKRLGRALRGWLVATGRAVATCARHGEPGCYAARLASARRKLQRALRPGCDRPPEALCTRLGCPSCENPQTLAECVAMTTTVAADLGRQTLAAESSRCARHAFRAAMRLAAARARSIAACEQQAVGPCLPGSGGEAAVARRLARRCAPPPGVLCGALGCDACGSSAELAACVAEKAGGALDAVTLRIYGN